MKAPDFIYQRPASLAGALQLLNDSKQDVQLLAGGQSLMPMLHLRIAQPDTLIDLNRIAELAMIDAGDSHIEIGSMVRYAQLQANEEVSRCLPLITAALPHIAHSAVRNRGTIGGSAALADPAAEMPALLIASNASINLISTQSSRTVQAEDFFTGLFETALLPGEIIQSFTIPKPSDGSAFGFYEITRRHGDYAMAGVAVTVQNKNPLRELKIVFFGVSDKPLRAHECEQALENHRPDDQDAIDRAILALQDLPFTGDPQTSEHSKRHLAGVALGRALQEIHA